MLTRLWQHEKLVVETVFRLTNYGTCDGGTRFILRIAVLPCKKSELILRVMWPFLQFYGIPCNMRFDHGTEAIMLRMAYTFAGGKTHTGASKSRPPGPTSMLPSR